jgi:hypothetical protein
MVYETQNYLVSGLWYLGLGDRLVGAGDSHGGYVQTQIYNWYKLSKVAEHRLMIRVVRDDRAKVRDLILQHKLTIQDPVTACD